MKRLLFFCVFSLIFSLQKTTAQTVTRSRAQEGDTVWVFINHVKADKRAQFEKFVNEIFWPMAKKLSAQDQAVFNQTRVLYPAHQEKDGTYKYFFIMDPVISGGNYDIESLLKKMYDQAKAEEYLKMFNETTSQEQTGYELVQSRW